MNENSDHTSHLSIIKQANQLLSAGNLGEAEKGFRFVLNQNQFNAEAWFGLSKIAENVVGIAGVVDCVLRAVAADPSSKEYRAKLKKITKKYNKIDRSLVHQKLFLLLKDTGNIKQSLTEIEKAIRLAPGESDNLLYFSKSLEDVRFVSKVESNVLENIIAAYECDSADHQSMNLATLSALKWDEGFKLLFNAINCDVSNEEWIVLLNNESVINSLNSKLLYVCLRSSLVTDVSYELLLTKIRKVMLFSTSISSNEGLVYAYRRFLPSLAMQCYYNEYVFYISQEEELWLEKLLSGILKELEQSEVNEGHLMLYAAYESLQAVIKNDISDKVSKHAFFVLDAQVNEPILETKLRDNIPAITDIDTGKSAVVKEQYEANPFPRWRSFPILKKNEQFSKFISRVSKNKCDGSSVNNKIKILIAGCGTGLIPCIYTKLFPSAKILAIDMTKASLAHGYRKAHELKLKNIEFAQADILNLDKVEGLNESFDFINCFGVLHHMENIEPGWKVLRSLLKKDGVMQIGLYSTLARQSVFEIRDYIKQQGYESTPEGMRQCRHDLIMRDDQFLSDIIKSRAFYSMSNFRDLAFHVHEICIDLMQLKAMLKELELEFLGFEFDYPEPVHQYNSLYPDDPDMTSLDNWNEYEKKYPDTFENTYKFLVKKL